MIEPTIWQISVDLPFFGKRYRKEVYSVHFPVWKRFEKDANLTSVNQKSVLLRVTKVTKNGFRRKYYSIPEHVNICLVLRPTVWIKKDDPDSNIKFKIEFRGQKDEVGRKHNFENTVVFLKNPRETYPELFMNGSFKGNRLSSLLSRDDVMIFKYDLIEKLYKFSAGVHFPFRFECKAYDQKVLFGFHQSFKKPNGKTGYAHILFIESLTAHSDVNYYLSHQSLPTHYNPGVQVAKQAFITSLFRSDFHNQVSLQYRLKEFLKMRLQDKFPVSYKYFLNGIHREGAFLFVPDTEAEKLDEFLLCTGSTQIDPHSQGFLDYFIRYRSVRRSYSKHIPQLEFVLLLDNALLLRPLKEVKHDFQQGLGDAYEMNLSRKIHIPDYFLDVEELLRSAPEINSSEITEFIAFLQTHSDLIPDRYRFNIFHKDASIFWAIWEYDPRSKVLPGKHSPIHIKWPLNYLSEKERVQRMTPYDRRRFDPTYVSPPRFHANGHEIVLVDDVNDN
jgi:hypothetical protein